jgi:hypothetical protein
MQLNTRFMMKLKIYDINALVLGLYVRLKKKDRPSQLCLAPSY